MRYLLVASLLLFTGCVSLSEPASILNSNVDLLLESHARIAKLAPEGDTELRREIEEAHWRVGRLIKPITSELERHAGPVPVKDKVPKSKEDVDRFMNYQRALEDFTDDIDAAAALPIGGAASGFAAVADKLSEHSLWGLPMSWVINKLLKTRKRLKKAESQRDSYHYSLNEAKKDPGAKPAIVAATSRDPILKEAYRERQIAEARNQQGVISQVLEMLV